MPQPPEMLERNVESTAPAPEQPSEPAAESRRILIIESGSPGITRRALPDIQRNFPSALCDLCTCWPDSDLSGFQTLYRTSDDPGLLAKFRRVWGFRKRRYHVLAVICSGERVMKLWRALALLLLPCRKMIVNENADFFWLDWENRRAVWRFLGTRWNGIRTESLLTIVRLVALPFTLILLVGTALFYYTRRWRRLLFLPRYRHAAPPPSSSHSSPSDPSTSSPDYSGK